MGSVAARGMAALSDRRDMPAAAATLVTSADISRARRAAERFALRCVGRLNPHRNGGIRMSASHLPLATRSTQRLLAENYRSASRGDPRGKAEFLSLGYFDFRSKHRQGASDWTWFRVLDHELE